MSYTIAAVTEDGQKISSHFGMAPLYRIFTIENDQIVGEEQREKHHHAVHPQHDHGHEHGHGDHDHGGKDTHGDMLAPVSDCRVLICGGMGGPAFQRAQSAGLEIVMVGGDIRQAVESYIRGEASSDSRRIHMR